MPSVDALVGLCRSLDLDTNEILERVAIGVRASLDVSDKGWEELRSGAEELFWEADYGGHWRCTTRCSSGSPMSRRGVRARVVKPGSRSTVRSRYVNAAPCALRRPPPSGRLLSREGMPTLQAEALMVLASLWSHEGLPDVAEPIARRAVDLSSQGGAKLQGQAWNQLAIVLVRAGRPDEAHGALLEARKFARAARDYRNALSIEGHIGSCLMARGRPRKVLRARHRPGAEARRPFGRGALAGGIGGGSSGGGRPRISRSSRPRGVANRQARRPRADGRSRGVDPPRSREAQVPRGDKDRHRVAYLRRLLGRVGHEGFEVVERIKRELLEPSGATEDGSH